MYHGDPVTLTMHVHYLFILPCIEKHIKPEFRKYIERIFNVTSHITAFII